MRSRAKLAGTVIGRRPALGLLLLTLACSRQPTSVGSAQTLRIGFIGTSETQPTGAEGFFHAKGELVPELGKLGFQPHFVRFGNGPDLNEALSGGSLDLGIYGDTPALVGRGAGLPTRLINQAVVGMDAWLLVRADGPRSLEDLAGRAVATSKGSYMNRYLAGLLAEKGLTDRVTIAHLLPADAQAALEKGDIAAYAAPAQTAPLLVNKGARIIDRASEHPGLAGTSVTVVTDAFLAKNPGFPAKWNELRARAVAEVIADSEGYYTFHAQAVHLSKDLVKQGFPLSLLHPEPLALTGLALLEGTKHFLVAQRLAQTDFELKTWAAPGAWPRD